MIFKRAVAKLRAQDWTAITIELLIVILGVFIGTLVANWNQERESKVETHRLLIQLKPEIDRIVDFSVNTQDYYATTRIFAQTALKGWARDPSVSDSQFVIAAYQASQVHGVNASPSWGLVFGGDQFRNIDDLGIRGPLGQLMTFDTDNLNVSFVTTPYRADVRAVIPDDIQEAIRKACGDKFRRDTADLSLPPTCDIVLDPEEAGTTAAELRSHPELAGELRSHLGIISGVLNQVARYKFLGETLQKKLAGLEA